jgi:hypothetical protein
MHAFAEGLYSEPETSPTSDSDLSSQETGLFIVNLAELQYCPQVDLSKLIPGQMAGQLDGDAAIVQIPDPRNSLHAKESDSSTSPSDWLYKRLLAYIYLFDGSCFNAELIREGYAHAYTRLPFQFLDEFSEIEQQAREQHKGLWARAVILDADS